MIEYLAENVKWVMPICISILAVIAIPLVKWADRLRVAAILRDADARAKKLAEENLKIARELADKHRADFEQHRTEIVGKLERLDRCHTILTRDVHEVKTLAAALDEKADSHAEQLAFVCGSLDAIKEGLNGFMSKKEK